MWTADSINITADQTCWTADGYDGCNVDSGAGSGGTTYAPQLDWDDVYNVSKRERIKRDDAEVFEAIKAILAKGIL